jgi:hypothetical protein
MIADVLTKPLGGQLFYTFANVLMGWTQVSTDFAETTRVRWNNSIVTATSSSERADATDKTFKVRPEPVEGVTYNGPIEARHGKNLPHNLERAKDDDAPGEEPLSGPDCLRDNDSITKEQQRRKSRSRE